MFSLRLPHVFHRPRLAVLLALIAIIASIALRDVTARLSLTGVAHTVVVVLATTIPLLAAGILIPMFTTSVGLARAVGLGRPWLRDLGIGLCAGLLVRAVTEIVAPTTGTAYDPFGRGLVPAIALSLLFAVFVSPLVEELLFRGVLQRALADGMRASGAVVATGISIAITTGVFALAHVTTTEVQIGLLVSTIAVGVVCGLLTAMTGRLAAAIAAHTVHNVIGVALLLW